MKGLSYKRVFSRYSVSLTSHLARFTYFLYKKVRIGLSKKYPLNEYEKYRFDNQRFSDDSSSNMPLGFNFSTKESEEAYLNLEYIDFYDFLPKENINTFKKELNGFAIKNKTAPFGSYRTAKDELRIDSMGRYVDGIAFSHLHDIKLMHNEYLERYAPQVTVSLINMSPSFLVVKYRFYISSSFNEKLNAICNTEYSSYTDVSRQFNIPWYKPKKFGKSIYTGNNARERDIYFLISQVKWEAFSELKHYFVFRFEHAQLFPPTFDTYSTNIRPSNSEDARGFWDSVMLRHTVDYAQEYNACVCWDYECGQYEGIKLSAYCGGNYSKSDHLPEIAQHDLSGIYAVYMTASSIRRIAERDIAVCNKRISNAIRKANTSLLLKIRMNVEQKLYYSYRFISEFTGDTIDHDDARVFRSRLYKKSSITASCLKGISKSTAETKKQIDNLLRFLDDTAEYGSTKSSLRLQWFMMLITVLSLIVAIVATSDFESFDLQSLWNAILTCLRLE